MRAVLRHAIRCNVDPFSIVHLDKRSFQGGVPRPLRHMECMLAVDRQQSGKDIKCTARKGMEGFLDQEASS